MLGALRRIQFKASASVSPEPSPTISKTISSLTPWIDNGRAASLPQNGYKAEMLSLSLSTCSLRVCRNVRDPCAVRNRRLTSVCIVSQAPPPPPKTKQAVMKKQMTDEESQKQYLDSLFQQKQDEVDSDEDDMRLKRRDQLDDDDW